MNRKFLLMKPVLRVLSRHCISRVIILTSDKLLSALAEIIDIVNNTILIVEDISVLRHFFFFLNKCFYDVYSMSWSVEFRNTINFS